MGLLNKLKDLFIDEEDTYETKEIEVEEKEEKNELPTFMRNKIEKDEVENKIKEEKKKDEEKQIAVLVEPKKKEEKKFSFDFDDDDFVETSRLSRSAIKKERKVQLPTINETNNNPVNNNVVNTNIQSIVKPYGNKKEIDKPKKFRPTPVISPVYGILDKNYTKEEVVSKEEDSYAIQRPSKKVDFESVRKKAYGDLTDDIRDSICENCEYLKEVKINKKIERLSEEDLLYNLTTDKKENLKEEVKDEIINNNEEELLNKDITLEEAVENYVDYGVSYDIPPRRTREKDDEVKIVNHADNEVVGEKVEVIEPIEEVVTKDKKETNDRKKDLELTDDLFNLIDSMYKERDD